MGQRVLALLEPPLYARVTQMARRDGISLSQKLRDLVREAVEHDEDADLMAIARERKRQGARLIPHAAFWRMRTLRRRTGASR